MAAAAAASGADQSSESSENEKLMRSISGLSKSFVMASSPTSNDVDGAPIISESVSTTGLMNGKPNFLVTMV
jgi:hypothetical protein